MGAKSGAKRGEPPIVCFSREIMTQGLFQGEDYRGAAHISVAEEDAAAGGKAMARKSFFEGRENVSAARM